MEILSHQSSSSIHITKNLLSVSQFALNNDVLFEFHPHQFFLKKVGHQGDPSREMLRNGMYVFSNVIPFSPPTVNTTTISHANDTYNARFGHVHASVIHRIMHHCNIAFSVKKIFCDSCILGKHHQLPFTDLHTLYTTPLQLIYIDIWGPSSIASSNGSYYYISFLIPTLNTHGFISYIINVMLLRFLNPLKSWLKTELVLLYKIFKLTMPRKIVFKVISC